jgi:class 3 adenylate cyclase
VRSLVQPTTSPSGRGARARGSLLLADISGYTSFLQGVTDAHHDIIVAADEPPAAYGFVSSLLDAMATAVAPPFRVVKFEGDALFAVADDPQPALRGAGALACLRGCYASFRTHLAEAEREWTCTCGSCSRIHALDLKFVLHHGEYVAQRIASHEDVAGPDVILAHRLLKNHVRDLVGARPYALLTDRAIDDLDVPVELMVAATEAYDGLPPVAVHVLPLD